MDFFKELMHREQQDKLESVRLIDRIIRHHIDLRFRQSLLNPDNDLLVSLKQRLQLKFKMEDDMDFFKELMHREQQDKLERYRILNQNVKKGEIPFTLKIFLFKNLFLQLVLHSPVLFQQIHYGFGLTFRYRITYHIIQRSEHFLSLLVSFLLSPVQMFQTLRT